MPDCKTCKKFEGINYYESEGFVVMCAHYGNVKPNMKAECDHMEVA